MRPTGRLYRLYNDGVPPRAKAGADRRTARRVPASHSARLLDISLGGLSIETSAPLEKGRVYDLILRLDNLRMPVACQVLRLRRSGSSVQASLVFDRILESDRQYLEQTLVREVAEKMTVILRLRS